MSLARIIASNPAKARHTARTLREAGYEVEIVAPGTPANSEAELEFDVDTDTMVSQSTDNYVPGEREFVLKPLWRKLTAKYRADKDVARAQQSARSAKNARVSDTEPMAVRAAAPSAPERREEREAAEAAMVAAEQRIARERQEREAARHRELDARRAEDLRLQRIREEREVQEIARQRELEAQRKMEAERRLEAQRAEARRQEELQRQQELVREHEYQQQQLALRRQREEREREETLHRQAEAEAVLQRQMAEEREQARLQEVMRREKEEAHRQEVMRQRQDEELTRRAEAQRLLLEANKQREDSAKRRSGEVAVDLAAAGATISSVPSVGEYLSLRLNDWKRARLQKAAQRIKITRIDRAAAFSRKQAGLITAVVAAAFLLGWGIAVYHVAPAKTVVQSPPTLNPGQYAPYPVAKPLAGHARPQPHAKRRAARDSSVAQDEVVVRHYYPSKAQTAQDRPAQRKKITDLQ